MWTPTLRTQDDARIAIAMVRVSKQKQELNALKEAAATNRIELDETLQVVQYLNIKVQSLRTVVAGLTVGTELKIMLNEYSEDLEGMERRYVAALSLLTDGVC